MSEEQFKAAAAENTEQLEEGVEEISEEELEGVAGGGGGRTVVVGQSKINGGMSSPWNGSV